MNKYIQKECVVFSKTTLPFGALSNMCKGFPINIFNRVFQSSETLYQWCKFKHHPDIQELIIKEQNPFLAKQIAIANKDKIRPDFDDIKVEVMKWCVYQKLMSNYNKFSSELLSTTNKTIVEFSYKDNFWGAMPYQYGQLMGYNKMGLILTCLRDFMIEGKINVFCNLQQIE